MPLPFTIVFQENTYTEYVQLGTKLQGDYTPTALLHTIGEEKFLTAS